MARQMFKYQIIDSCWYPNEQAACSKVMICKHDVATGADTDSQIVFAYFTNNGFDVSAAPLLPLNEYDCEKGTLDKALWKTDEPNSAIKLLYSHEREMEDGWMWPEDLLKLESNEGDCIKHDPNWSDFWYDVAVAMYLLWQTYDHQVGFGFDSHLNNWFNSIDDCSKDIDERIVLCQELADMLSDEDQLSAADIVLLASSDYIVYKG